jgi:hypothetical protein
MDVAVVDGLDSTASWNDEQGKGKTLMMNKKKWIEIIYVDSKALKFEPIPIVIIERGLRKQSKVIEFIPSLMFHWK